MRTPSVSRRVPALGCALLGSIVLLGGCTSQNYCVRRSALVPWPAPSLRPARQPEGYVEANVSSEVLSYLKPPQKLQGRNVGLYVPRSQLAGYLLFSPHRLVSFGFSFESGYREGAMAVSRGLIAPPRLSIGGAGMHFALHSKVSDRVTVGWSCDGWAYAVSSHIAFVQSDNCDSPPPYEQWTHRQYLSAVFIGRTQLAVGLDFKWSYLSLGAGVRNQPHNVDESSETHYTSATISPRIHFAVYPYIFLSWEFKITRIFHVGLTVYQPLNFDPVIYAPVFGFNLRLTHWARERHDWVGPPPENVPVTPYPY